MRPIIFSGTTEGRILSEYLSEKNIRHIVCVATEYGRLVMHPDQFADIREGRLDSDEMTRLITDEGSVVFDATHPYADVVSANIRRACENSGKEYIRIYRPEVDDGSTNMIRCFDSSDSCAAALKKTTGNILLTTGSKELSVFTADPLVRERLFVRILPSEESIRICKDAGITGRHIIAMQGPFSTDLNVALMRQYGIDIMVTKSSGRAGGLPEKLEAARKSGAFVYMIGRPQEEDGITVRQALSRYFGEETKPDNKKHMHVDLIGIGPGDDSLMTVKACEAVRSAEIVFGADRMVRPYNDRCTYPYYRADDIIPVLEEKKPGRIAVLFSGDTGFSSGCTKMHSALTDWFEKNDYGYEIDTIPGISSFAYFAAKTGEDYTDAELLSIHGRSQDGKAIADLIRSVRSESKTFVLLSGDRDVRKLGSILNDNNLSHTIITLGYQLSYPEEKIFSITPDECQNVSAKGLYIALVTNPMPQNKLLMPVIPDDCFIRDKVPMTKESVRHLSILKLGLRKGSVLYDIGSGTGSIACEAASLDESVTVYAIEMKEQACELIKTNASNLGLTNIEMIHGCAPAVLPDLKPPTHAFIGGSSGNLKGILEALPEGTRVVLNAVSLETIAEIQSVSREFDMTDLTIEQISVARSRELGSYHLMTAENPVMIAAFTLGSQ